jgi:hypothetical protein
MITRPWTNGEGAASRTDPKTQQRNYRSGTRSVGATTGTPKHAQRQREERVTTL